MQSCDESVTFYFQTHYANEEDPSFLLEDEELEGELEEGDDEVTW